MDVRVGVDEAEAARIGAEWIAGRVRDAVRRRGAATIAVSGGHSPIPMWAELAALDVPWSAVTVFQVDERVAPDGHEARNANQLAALPLPSRNLHLMPVTAKDLGAACRRYASSLPERFDVVHLGLGDDGHTASWAPGDPVIDDPAPVAMCGLFNEYRRMTLTPAVVNAARRRLMHAPGGSKAAQLAAWLAGATDIPVHRVHRTGTVLVTDRPGASALPGRGR